jgi:hypothetical protein
MKKHKKGYWVHWWFDKVFRVNFYLLFKASDEQTEEWLKKQKIDVTVSWGGCGARAIRVTLPEGRGAGVVLQFPEWSPKPYYLAAVAHECIHASNWVFEDRGAKLDPDNDEAFCYYHMYLMREVLEAIETVPAEECEQKDAK